MGLSFVSVIVISDSPGQPTWTCDDYWWLSPLAESSVLDYEVARGGLQAAAAALTELTEMGRKKHVHPDVLAQLQERYETRGHAAEEAMRAMQMERGVLRDEEARRASRHLMMVEKEHVLDAYHRR